MGVHGVDVCVERAEPGREGGRADAPSVCERRPRGRQCDGVCDDGGASCGRGIERWREVADGCPGVGLGRSGAGCVRGGEGWRVGVREERVAVCYVGRVYLLWGF